MKGYKVFNPDWTCRDFKYEVGETYEMQEKPKICDHGFHFCTDLKDCFWYYRLSPDTKIAKVKALGDIDYEKYTELMMAYIKQTGCIPSKYCTNKIKILKEIPYDQLEIRTYNKCTSFVRTEKIEDLEEYDRQQFRSPHYGTDPVIKSETELIEVEGIHYHYLTKLTFLKRVSVKKNKKARTKKKNKEKN